MLGEGGGRDVIKSIRTIRNQTAAWTEIIVTDANAKSPCQIKIYKKKIVTINAALF